MTGATVAPAQRFTRARPCPICGGHAELPQGHGIRCYGFLSEDGEWARCTREDRAQALRQGPDGTFSHHLTGPCRCGSTHGEAPPATLRLAPAPSATDAARRLWREAQPAGGTVVEAYLRGRGLTGPIPATLRFHPRCWHAESKQHLPAMIALVQGPDGRARAVHRTYLRPDGQGKASAMPVRKSLGRVAGGAVHLAPAGGHLIIAEGIESSLSAQQAAGTPAWAGVSAAGLAALALPALPLAAEVIIMADPDEAGRRAASAAAARWHGEGRTVRIALPDPGTDANDLLQARP